jgi:trehalose 6-phosphate phosphatase
VSAYALSRAGWTVIERAAVRPLLLAFDFDGTLAPIVARTERAAMRRRTRRGLARVASRFPCIVLSGRSQADLRARLGGIALCAVLGNHGLEPAHASPRLQRRVSRWHRSLESSLSGLRGVWIENKTYSLSIHYRGARQRAPARRNALRALREIHGARILGGKCVLNVLPDLGVDKGTALLAELARLCCERAVYVGDDETDEAVFALERAQGLIGVRVGRKRSSRARLHLRDQREIDDFLEGLLKTSAAAQGGAGPAPSRSRARSSRTSPRPARS